MRRVWTDGDIKKDNYMTIKDIQSHRYSATQFYDMLVRTSIVEAQKEPLKLAQLCELTTTYKDNRITYAEGLIIACAQSIERYYRFRRPMEDEDKLELASRVLSEYSHYSVNDLKCFETMLISANLPTIGSNGREEYELVAIDVPHIMAKLKIYDQKRPYRSEMQKVQQDICPHCELTLWKQTHLLDGTEYDFRVPYGESEPRGDAVENAMRYWFEDEFKPDERDEKAIDAITHQYQTNPIVQRIN